MTKKMSEEDAESEDYALDTLFSDAKQLLEDLEKEVARKFGEESSDT